MIITKNQIIKIETTIIRIIGIKAQNSKLQVKSQKTIIRIVRMSTNLRIIRIKNHNANKANLCEYSE